MTASHPFRDDENWTIARAKSHVLECEKAAPEQFAYLLGASQVLIADLIRIAESRGRTIDRLDEETQ